MPIVNEKQFLTSAQNIPKSNIYFLFGEEIYLINTALNHLINKTVDPNLKDFNYNIFYGQAQAAEQIRDTIDTLPMMASQRVVVIKDFQDIKSKELAKLIPVFEKPVDSTILILQSNKVDKRTKAFKTLQKNALLAEFKKPYDNEIPTWIQHIAKTYGLSIGNKESRVFHQIVGSSLLCIDNEIKKLTQYLGDKKEISLKDIEQVVSHSRIESVFDLANAIGQKDQVKALTCLANLLENGNNAVAALSLITRHVRILALIKQGLSEGLPSAKLSTKAGIPPFFLKKYQDQSMSWNLDKINQTYKALLTTDRALKSSPISSHIWLENFVLKTCS